MIQVAAGAVVWLLLLTQQPPVFRSGVQIVEIDARVFDANGRFVGDLTRGDFEILEDGKPQPIASFYLVREIGTSSPEAALSSSSGAASAPSLPQTRQTWIFFFDLNHLTPGSGFDRARKAVEEFIGERFRQGDVAGVLAGNKMINNRLTSVRQELLDAVKQVTPRPETSTRRGELTRAWPRLLDEEEVLRIARNERGAMERAVARACNDDATMCQVADTEVRMKAARLAREIQRSAFETMNAISALAKGLGRIPGPKTVVFLSDGFNVQEAETTLRSVVGQTTWAGARIYAVDVRGLGRLGAPDPGATAAEDPAGAVTRFDAIADAPNSLAIDTGGLMIRNENNIGRALNTIAADSSTYYVLGFSPSSTTWDGKFRAVEVRVKRPGVRVRARKGYLALAPMRLVQPQPVAPRAPEAGEAVVAREAPAATVGAAAPAEVTTAPVLPDPLPSPPPPTSVRLRPDAADKVRELAGNAMPARDAAVRGWEAYQRGDIEAAIGPLEQAAAAPDARPWILYALGLAQTGLGRPADAVATWERVRAAVPDFSAVYMDLAATHTAMSDLSKALEVLRDAEKRWPTDPEVHNAIGVVHFRRGALDEALHAFERAASVAPQESMAYMNLGRTYEARFVRSRRYVTSQRLWTANDDDRRKAIDSYQRYVTVGGPYADAAKEALQRLDWAK